MGSDTDSSAFWEGRPLRFHSPRGRGDSPVSVDILHLAYINFAGGVCVRAGDDSCLDVLALLPSEFIIIPSFCIPTVLVKWYFLLSIKIWPPPRALASAFNSSTLDKTECAFNICFSSSCFTETTK